MQRKLPSKRYSSYIPPTDMSSLEDHVTSISCDPERDRGPGHPNCRSASLTTPEKINRRKSLNTLHFDALQNAVSKLARIDDFYLEELGYGYFSDVFKVTHKLSGKVMVLKRNKSTNTKMNILREVQLMNRLSHPNILKFNGVCVHEGQLHGLTEYINGGDLDQLVQKRSHPLSWGVRIRLALDISRGLSYLHSMNIFHRDLTAKNCLVRFSADSNGKKKYSAVVADLGLAEKIPSNPQEEAKMKVVGTPYCMAPEVLREKPYNQQSDIFSFGIIICQLIVRTSSDPEKLPRSNDFGLARDLFYAMVTKGVGSQDITGQNEQPSVPSRSFLQLAFDCCEVDMAKRPLITQISQRLEQTLTEEKKTRMEKKRLVLLNNHSIAKRQSTVLAEIPSFTAFVEPSTPERELPTRCRTGSDKENGGRPIEPTHSKHPFQDHSSNSSSGRRSSGSGSCSRLSRSYSDISSELISHAKSMIASSREKVSGDPDESDMNSVMSSLNEAFINPFTTIDISENFQRKMFDLPSSELLEMTFDLPARLPPGSPAHTRRQFMRQKHRRHSARPNSLLLDVHGLKSVDCNKQPLTPEPFSGVPNLSLTATGNNQILNCPSSPLLSPISPDPPFTPDQKLNIPFQGRLKQAMMRSMALSPQGCRLLSWWHCHGRGMDWTSISSVLSVMSDKFGKIQRSISLPNLTQDSSSLAILSDKMFTMGGSMSRGSSGGTPSPPSLSTNQKPPSGFKVHHHPPYATLPRKKKSRLHPVSSDMPYKLRSRTYDDVFQDSSLLGILHEESGDSKAEVTRTSTPLPGHCGTLGPRHRSLGNETYDLSSDMTLDSTEINNNTLKCTTSKDKSYVRNCPSVGDVTGDELCHRDSRRHDTAVIDCVGATVSFSLKNQVEFYNDDFRDLHTQYKANLPSSNVAGQSDVRDGSASSSSSSSGMSSTGLNMTIETGMVSSNRRRRLGVIVPDPRPLSGLSPVPCGPTQTSTPPIPSHGHVGSPPLSSSSQDSLGRSWKSEDLGGRRDSEASQKSNRDSGYNEDVTFSDHSTGQFSEPPSRGEGPFQRPSTAPNSKPVTLVPPPTPTHKKKIPLHDFDPNLQDLSLVTTTLEYPSDIIGSRCNVPDCNGSSPPTPLVGEMR